MIGYYTLRKEAFDILNKGLSNKLYYHSIHHTQDVLQASKKYLESENVSGEDAKIVRIGILLHDIGFTVSNECHEEESIIIAKRLMTKYGFTQNHFLKVKGLILATRIPQTPKSLLEKIICDADLDYLGRNDFYKISDKLFEELKAFSIVSNKNEWNKIQIKFLESHHYHTSYGIKNRQPEKEKRLSELKSLLR